MYLVIYMISIAVVGVGLCRSAIKEREQYGLIPHADPLVMLFCWVIALIWPLALVTFLIINRKRRL